MGEASRQASYFVAPRVVLDRRIVPVVMTSKTQIRPLRADANIYVVLDASGRSIGTGTKEVCEVLARLAAQEDAANLPTCTMPRPTSSENVRSATTI